MNYPHHVLPPAAAAALYEVTEASMSEVGLSRGAGLMVDQGRQTVILEPLKGDFILRLSRDCPFDEIAPVFLTLYVRNLAQRNPAVDVACRIGCGHPIVASLPLGTSCLSTEAEWRAVLADGLAVLTAALERQREVASAFDFDAQETRYSHPWPDVEVSSEQLRGLARFEETFRSIAGDRRKDIEERIPPVLELGRQLEDYLRTSGLLQPDREWVRVLLRPELSLGFWDRVDFREMSAPQLVAILNAIIQGGRHNEALPRRAYLGPLVLALLGRAKQLAG